VSEFDEATAVQAVAPGSFQWRVPDGWQQGRGAWGGLVVGALARAVAASEPDRERTLRTVSVQIVAPALVGPLSIRTEIVRRGSSMSTWSSVCRDLDDHLVATMVAIDGAPRANGGGPEPADWGTVPPPTAPRAEDVPLVSVGPPLGPVFARHCTMRPVVGMPLSGEPAESVGWVGLVDPTPPSAVSLLALVDAWWPASLSLLSSMPRVATVSFTANLLIDPATVAADEQFLHHSFLTAASEGFTSEHRRLWTADGRLAVDNLQTIVVGA
jgi:hypothetical protein